MKTETKAGLLSAGVLSTAIITLVSVQAPTPKAPIVPQAEVSFSTPAPVSPKYSPEVVEYWKKRADKRRECARCMLDHKSTDCPDCVRP